MGARTFAIYRPLDSPVLDINCQPISSTPGNDTAQPPSTAFAPRRWTRDDPPRISGTSKVDPAQGVALEGDSDRPAHGSVLRGASRSRTLFRACRTTQGAWTEVMQYACMTMHKQELLSSHHALSSCYAAIACRERLRACRHLRLQVGQIDIHSDRVSRVVAITTFYQRPLAGAFLRPLTS